MTEHHFEKLDYQIKSHLTATDYRQFVKEHELIGLSQQAFVRMLVKKYLNESAINELSASREHESSSITVLRGNT